MLFHELRHFLQLFPEKLIEMQRHGSWFKKLQSFCQIDDFSCFFTNLATFCNLLLETSSKHQKLLVRWKNHRFGQNYATFWNKLPCFGLSMNFSAKASKKLLNSWKSTKNHPFGQIFATFRTNYHVFAFR